MEKRAVKILGGFLCFALNIFYSQCSHHNVLPTATVSSSQDINRDEYNPGVFVNLGFSRFSVAEAKDDEARLQDEYDFTAILVNNDPISSLLRSVHQLIDTHVFKEIIVWNNNSRTNISRGELLAVDQPLAQLRVINGIVNSDQSLQYSACIQGKTRACLYVNEEWSASPYMQTLLAEFRSKPHHLHMVSHFHKHHMHVRRTYFDSNNQKRNGLLLMGFGKVFTRQSAQMYLKILREQLGSNHGEGQTARRLLT